MTTVPQELFQNTSLTLTGYIPTCYRHCKYKNHRRKLIFSSSLFSTQMLDFLAAFRPKANMPPNESFQIINSVLLKRFHCDFPIPWLTRIHSVRQSHIFGYILNERVIHRGNIFLRYILNDSVNREGIGNISFLRYLK